MAQRRYGNEKTYKEHSNCGEQAIIEKIFDYKDSHLLRFILKVPVNTNMCFEAKRKDNVYKD